MSANISSMINRLSHDEAITRFEPVVVAFTTGTPIEGPWPLCVAAPDVMKTVYDSFKDVHKEASTGHHGKQAERNALRPGFNQTFIDVADFVELASRKDATVPYRAGFEFFWKAKGGSSSSHTSLTATTKFIVINEEERGMVLAKVSGVAGAKSYEIQITYGDPTVEENWSHFATHGGGSKMIMRNLNVGKLCSFRVRAVGTNEYGPWSHYVTLTIT